MDVRPLRRPGAVAIGSLCLLLACAAPGSGPSDGVGERSAAFAEPEEGCGLVRASAFPEPIALVREYVRRDAEGQFLQWQAWADTAYLCPGFLPGPDEFTVVASSVVTPLDWSDSIARGIVRSRQIGVMTQDDQGLLLRPVKGEIVDTFVLRQTPYGWRIESPRLPNRVHAGTVLRDPQRFPLRPADQERLEAAVRSAPTGADTVLARRLVREAMEALRAHTAEHAQAPRVASASPR